MRRKEKEGLGCACVCWGGGGVWKGPSTLSIYRSSTLSHSLAQTRNSQTKKTKSGCDIIHRKRSQTTFSLSFCVDCCWVKLGPLCVFVADREGKDREELEGCSSWSCPPPGYLKSNSRIVFLWLSKTLHELRYSGDTYFSTIQCFFSLWLFCFSSLLPKRTSLFPISIIIIKC